MKDIIIGFIALAIWIAPPYIIVFIAWILSGISFSYTEAVTSATFYAIGIAYCVIIGWAPAVAWAEDRLEW